MKDKIIFGILFLAIITSGCLGQAPDKNESIYSCSQDSDCVLVQAGCCNCNHGGQNTAINKNHEESYINNVSSECAAVSCIAVISDHPSCSDQAEAKCIENRCEVIIE